MSRAPRARPNVAAAAAARFPPPRLSTAARMAASTARGPLPAAAGTLVRPAARLRASRSVCLIRTSPRSRTVRKSATTSSSVGRSGAERIRRAWPERMKAATCPVPALSPPAQTSPLNSWISTKIRCGCMGWLLLSRLTQVLDAWAQLVKGSFRPRGWPRTGRHLAAIRARRNSRSHEMPSALTRGPPGCVLVLPAKAVTETRSQVTKPDLDLTETIRLQDFLRWPALVDHCGRRRAQHPHGTG